MSKKLERNDPFWCGSGKKYKNCHMRFDEKIHGFELEGHIVPRHDIIKTPEQIEGIRESGKVNIAVLDYVAENIRAGISTEQINKWVDDKTRELGGVPAPLGYEGFPKSVCTSINDEVCHGIPSEDVILKEGDIINVDVSTIYKGYFSDSSRMFIIGKTTPDKEKLVRVAKECVEEGIKAVKPWTFLGDMADAVNRHAKENGYSIVVDIGGHGVVRLSGGQRQRLGIARALYHNPEILVFDEATSALDTDTETAIMEAIESFHGKKTLVIIAHRLRTIAGCDIIYKVDNGKIVETTLAAEEH